MAVLKSDVAVTYANHVLGLVSQIRSLRAAIAEIVKVNVDNPLGNFWAALHTASVGSDGSLGLPDSGAPVAANPIDTRVYTQLQRAVKAGDLTSALQVLVDFSTFCDGLQVNANLARPAQINNVSL